MSQRMALHGFDEDQKRRRRMNGKAEIRRAYFLVAGEPRNAIFRAQFKMYLSWSSCALYLLACQVRATVGDSRLCCSVRVTSFEC